MQTMLGIPWLKTEQITAVQVIGEVIHAVFETPARLEEFVLATGHGSDGLGGVSTHGFAGKKDGRDQVGAGVGLGLAAPRIENVGERG